MNYTDFKQELYSHIEKKFKEFNSPLSNSKVPTCGIRIPILKKLVKEHYLDEDLHLQDFEINETTELDIAYFLVGMLREKDYLSQLKFLDKNLKFAKGWMVTDSLNQYQKKPTFDVFFPYFKKWAKSKNEFVKRTAFIMGMTFSKQDKVMKLLPYIDNDEKYFVVMGEAWFLATVAIRYFDDVYLTLLREDVSLSIKKKTISKMIDSFRITDENKNKMKELRNSL